MENGIGKWNMEMDMENVKWKKENGNGNGNVKWKMENGNGK